MVNNIINVGMQSRLNKILNREGDGKTLMLAIDHPYFQGPTTGLKQMSKTIETLMPYCDCLMTTRGAVRNNIAPEAMGTVPIMMRVSGGNSILYDHMDNEKITVTLKDAIKMDATGVAVSVFIGSKNEAYQQQTILNLTDMVNEAEQYGIPVLAVTAVGKELVRDLRYLGLASRMCQDLGARIVKTYYCDGFEKLIDQLSPVPVVVAGGRVVPTEDAMELAYNSIQAGAVGVDMGRNFFQNTNPVGMIKAVRGIVHDGLTVREGLDVYNSEKSEKLL